MSGLTSIDPILAAMPGTPTVLGNHVFHDDTTHALTYLAGYGHNTVRAASIDWDRLSAPHEHTRRVWDLLTCDGTLWVYAGSHTTMEEAIEVADSVFGQTRRIAMLTDRDGARILVYAKANLPAAIARAFDRLAGATPTAEHLVTLATRPGDLVLDCHDQTVALAAHATGRRWIALEPADATDAMPGDHDVWIWDENDAWYVINRPLAAAA